MALYALGHSTRPLEEFLGILRRHGIATLADIRTVPRSAHNPQYDQPALKSALARGGIGYVHLASLGGLRRSKGENPDTAGWRNRSFRAYADYMQTPEFEAGLAELLALPGPVAMMCAEAVPWRCHRSLVADALTARGMPVLQITAAEALPHRLTPFAEVRGTRVVYPAAAAPDSAHGAGK